MIICRARDPQLPLAALWLLHEKGEAGPMLRRLWKARSPAIDAFLDELAQRDGESSALAAFLGWGSADCVARHVDRASEQPCPELWWRLQRNHPRLLIDPLIRHLRGTLGAYRKDAHLAYAKAFAYWLPHPRLWSLFPRPVRHPEAALLLLERWQAVLQESGRPRAVWKESTFEHLSRVIPEATVDAALRLEVVIGRDEMYYLARSLRADQLIALLATQPSSLGDGWSSTLDEPKAFFAAHPEVLEAALAQQMARPIWLDRFLCFLPGEREAERLRGWQTWLDAVRSPHGGLTGHHWATLPPDLRAVELRRALEERPPPGTLAPNHSWMLGYLPTGELAARLQEPLQSPDRALRARAVDLLFSSLKLCWPESPGDLAPARLVLSTLLDQGDQPAEVWCRWLAELRCTRLVWPAPVHEALAGVVGVVLALKDESGDLSLHLEHWLASMARSQGDFALRQMARVLAAKGGLRPRRWSLYTAWSSKDARGWNLHGRTNWIAEVRRSGGGEALFPLAQAFASAGESALLDELLQLVRSEVHALPAQEAWSALLLAQAEKEGALPWLRWLLLFSRSAEAAAADHRVALRAAVDAALRALPVAQRVTVLAELTSPCLTGPTPGDVLWGPLWAVLPQASPTEALTLAARAHLAAPEAAVAALLGAIGTLSVGAKASLLLAFVRARPRALRGTSPHRGALLQTLGESLREAGFQGASSLTPDLRGRRLRRCLQEIATPG